MRKFIALIGTAVALLALAALPATAQSSDTTVDVTVTGGSLTITADATASLGSVSNSAGSTASNGTPISTTVDDGRGSLLGWTVTALSDGDMTGSTQVDTDGDGTADAIPTIDLGDLAAGGPLTWASSDLALDESNLLGSLTGVSLGAGGSVNPSQAITAATSLVGAGGGAYTYDTTLTLAVPANTYANEYTVTITQTVQ